MPISCNEIRDRFQDFQRSGGFGGGGRDFGGSGGFGGDRDFGGRFGGGGFDGRRR